MNCRKCNTETGADWKDLCRTCYKNRSPEEVRVARQQKLDRKIARIEKKAERLESQANQKMEALAPYHGDIAFFTQPATPNSPFGKRRRKLFDRYGAGIKLSVEAQELKEKAEYLGKVGAVVKGDAERKREEDRTKADAKYSMGSKIYDFAYREGTVIKVNKKTFTIKFDSGITTTRDKSYFV